MYPTDRDKISSLTPKLRAEWLGPVERLILTILKNEELEVFDLRQIEEMTGTAPDTLHMGLKNLVKMEYLYDQGTFFKVNNLDEIPESPWHCFPGEQDLIRALIDLDIRSMTTIAKSSGIKAPNLSNWVNFKGGLSRDAVARILHTLGAEGFTGYQDDLENYHHIDYSIENQVIPILFVSSKNSPNYQFLLFHLELKHGANNKIKIERIQDQIIDGKLVFLVGGENSAYTAIVLIPANLLELKNIIPPPSKETNTLEVHLDVRTPDLVDPHHFQEIIKNKLPIDHKSLDDLLRGHPDPFLAILDQFKKNTTKGWKDVRAIASDYGLSAEDIFNCIRKEHCSRS